MRGRCVCRDWHVAYRAEVVWDGDGDRDERLEEGGDHCEQDEIGRAHV